MNLNTTTTSVQTMRDLPASWKVFQINKNKQTKTNKRKKKVAMIVILNQYRHQANFSICEEK